MFQVTYQLKDKTLKHSTKHPSKGNRHTDVVVLHRELHFNLNRHIRHGRALKNIGLWSRVHKIQAGVRQKAECHWNPWSFENRIGNKIRVLKHVRFRISAPSQVVLNHFAMEPCLAGGGWETAGGTIVPPASRSVKKVTTTKMNAGREARA